MINPDKARQLIEAALAAAPELRLATYDVGASRPDCNCPLGVLLGESYPFGDAVVSKAVGVRQDQAQEIIKGFEGESVEGGWAKFGAALRAHERFIG